MELEPIRERIDQLRQLTDQYGSHLAIPAEDLDRIGYSRHYDAESETTRLLPIGLLGEIAAKEALKDEIMPTHDIPFCNITVQLDTTLRYGSTLDGAVLRRQLYRSLSVLEYFSADEDITSWLYGSEMQCMSDELQGTAYARQDGRIYGVGFGTMESEILSVIERLYDTSACASDTPYIHQSADLIHLLDLDERDEVYNAVKAEDLVSRLERIRSILTDLPEIEGKAYAGFSELYVKDDRFSSTFAESELGDSPLYDITAMSPADMFTARLRPLHAFLLAKGFPDVAESRDPQWRKR